MAKVFQIDTGGTLTTNLVSYYKLENVNDYWGTNHLTNNNAATFVAGKVNNAVNLVGASLQYLNKTDATGLPIGAGARSFAFWINLSTLTQYGAIISYGAETTQNGMQIHWNSGTTQMYINICGYAVVIDTVITIDTWNHFIVTYPGSGNIFTVYKNNVSLGTVDLGFPPNTSTSNNLSIGKRLDAYYFSGKIDELGVWTKVLSATERTDLYNGGAGQTMIEQTSNPAFLLNLIS